MGYARKCSALGSCGSYRRAPYYSRVVIAFSQARERTIERSRDAVDVILRVRGVKFFLSNRPSIDHEQCAHGALGEYLLRKLAVKRPKLCRPIQPLKPRPLPITH